MAARTGPRPQGSPRTPGHRRRRSGWAVIPRAAPYRTPCGPQSAGHRRPPVLSPGPSSPGHRWRRCNQPPADNRTRTAPARSAPGSPGAAPASAAGPSARRCRTGPGQVSPCSLSAAAAGRCVPVPVVPVRARTARRWPATGSPPR